MAKKKKTGLGRGLDSLIPKFPDIEDSDEDSSSSLEDMLKEKDEGEEKSETSKNELPSAENKIKKPKSKTKPKKTDIDKEIKIEAIEEEIDTEIISEKEINTSNLSSSEDITTSPTSKLDESITEDINSKNFETHSNIDNIESSSSKNEIDDVSIDDEEINIDEIKNNLSIRERESIEEVVKIIEKNPRITLWSAKSAAVLRYLRKTEPEFSISKEASKLIDEAIENKYPEIWILFKDIENKK